MERLPQFTFRTKLGDVATELSQPILQTLLSDGVARFARMPMRWLLLGQFIMALLGAALAVWFVRMDWVPVIGQAVQSLPPAGEIRGGIVQESSEEPCLLAENHFIAFINDKNHTGTIRSPAHIQVEIGDHFVRVISLFGYLDIPFPESEWILLWNRTELEPWWGAWRPPILWSIFGAATVGLLMTWWVMATILAGPTWLIAFFFDRELSFTDCWKYCCAAFMPGSCLMMFAVLLYGMGFVDLVTFVVLGVAHFAMDLLVPWAGLFLLPRSRKSPRVTNPFSGSD